MGGRVKVAPMTKPKNTNKTVSRKSKNSGKAFERELKQKAAAREKAYRASQKQFERELRALEKTGIYVPKEKKLTKYRKARVRKAYAEFADQLNPANFVFVKAPAKKKRVVLKKTATMPDVFKNTKTGFFVAKDGFKKAELKKSARTGDYYVKRSGKVETGTKASKTTSSVIPIVSVDEMDLFRDKIENAKKTLGPLKKGETYEFVIHDVEGKHRSRMIYQDLDIMFDQFKGASSARAMSDPQLKPLFLAAMRHLEIRKVKYEYAVKVRKQETAARIKAKEKRRAASRKVNRKGRNL